MERAYWLAWSQIPRVGPISIGRLQKHFGTLAAAWDATSAELGQVEGFGDLIVKTVVKERLDLNPEEFLTQHLQKNPNFWTPADPDYPRLLLEIPNPPSVLYYSGTVELLENQSLKPTIAIVGTRNPTDYGKRWTRKISAALAKHGFTVVSGMAEGIDTEAHDACLEAGGRTLAVLGTGIDLVYPARNRRLHAQIQQQGLVLSEYPAGTQPSRTHFPQRNRIIAGLSRAILVMEAPTRSGALITAYQANEYCRDVYALPGSLENEQALGCLGLLSRGAHVILSEGHLLEALGAIPQLDSVEVTATRSQPLIPNLEPQLAQVLQAISTEAIAFDSIVQQVGLAAGTVSGVLLQLELMGLVSQLPGMQYRRS